MASADLVAQAARHGTVLFAAAGMAAGLLTGLAGLAALRRATTRES
jgi:hypothetical protein